MKLIHIPQMAWMRLRQRGRYCFSQNTSPTIWTSDTSKIPDDAKVYCISWGNGQQRLIANKILLGSEVNK